MVGVGAIIDRTGGRNPFAVPFRALTGLDLPTWTDRDCPLCRGGGAPEKPGSRTRVSVSGP